MRIRYGYDDYKEGWVNINPTAEKYSAVDKTTGADCKITLEDIPLFWTSRIKEMDINVNMNYTEEELIQYRLKAVLEMVYTSPLFDIPEAIREKYIRKIFRELYSIFIGGQ